MKKTIQVLLAGVIVMMYSCVLASSNPKDIIKKGTKLVYDVNYSGTNYELTIIVKDYIDEYMLDWNLSAPSDKKGSMIINKDAIENAAGIFNFFTDKTNLADECCLIMSRKMYNTFKTNGAMEINTDKKNNVFTLFGNPYDHTQNFGYKNDFSYEFNCRTVSNDNNYQITYVNDPNFPLIVEMKLDWSLRLKNIVN